VFAQATATQQDQLPTFLERLVVPVAHRLLLLQRVCYLHSMSWEWQHGCIATLVLSVIIIFECHFFYKSGVFEAVDAGIIILLLYSIHMTALNVITFT